VGQSLSNANAHPTPFSLLERLAGRAAERNPAGAPCTRRIPVSVYTDPGHFERERETLFLRRPVVLGHESQLPGPGDALTWDWLGLPLITRRDKAGQIGTFLNVCRHRGMRLVQEEGPGCLRSLVCPYHQWTYGLDGALRNIPRNESFSGLDPAEFGLVALPTEVRHGLIWIQADRERPMDLDTHLAGLGLDLDTFQMAGYTFCRQHVRTIECNWKLIQDAFLDGYHVVRLHKNTVGPFFRDALAESDRIGNHIRSAVARKEIAEVTGMAREQLDLRYHASFAYTVFPNAVLIFHPEYTSIISLFPQGPGRTLFAHAMLTPEQLETDEKRDHFRRSFELIDQGVFQSEDIFVSEAAQKGMSSGANDTLLFGSLEESAVWFHETVERELASG